MSQNVLSCRLYLQGNYILYRYKKGGTLMFKKILSVVMVVVLCCSLGSTANAQSISTSDSSVQPRYSYTSTVSTTLTSSSGNARCGTSVLGYDGITTKIKITMTLQKKTLLWWSKVETWTTTANDYVASIAKTVSVDSGKYRVKAEIVTYSGSASESITQYSSEKEF